jgi:hypothetical protein
MAKILSAILMLMSISSWAQDVQLTCDGLLANKNTGTVRKISIQLTKNQKDQGTMAMTFEGGLILSGPVVSIRGGYTFDVSSNAGVRLSGILNQANVGDSQFAPGFRMEASGGSYGILSCKAAADRVDPKIEAGQPCTLEGERAYVPNGEDQEVFVCEKGKWVFLYTRVPGEERD